MDYLIYDFAVAETSGKLIDYTVVSGNERGEYYPPYELKQPGEHHNLSFPWQVLLCINEEMESMDKTFF